MEKLSLGLKTNIAMNVPPLETLTGWLRANEQSLVGQPIP
jgi:hypothetical protein